MILKKIELTNYRCFRTFDIEFGDKVTVLIGKNGAGKSSLISSIKQSLSFIFSKRKGLEGYDFMSSSEQTITSFRATEPYLGKTKFGHEYIYPISIKADGRVGNKDIEWEFLKEDASGGLNSSKYSSALVDFWDYYDVANLPLLAYFSDSYPHIVMNIGPKVEELLDTGNALPASMAYHKWDEERNCTSLWESYIVQRWKKRAFAREKTEDILAIEQEMQCINDTLVKFTKPLSEWGVNEDFEIDHIEIEPLLRREIIVVYFKNGEYSHFESLPQGYKRLFSMVLDLTMRSYLINKHANPEGVVLMDEIESHLHPTLQQEVLQRFMRTFPRLQFIISTHSPLVVTNLKQDDNCRTYRLSKNEEYKLEQLDNVFGIDYNSGLKDVMEANGRDVDIENMIETYQHWKEQGNEEMIQRFKCMLEDVLGKNNKFFEK